METKHHLNEVTNINYQINDTAELEVVEYYIILLLNAALQSTPGRKCYRKVTTYQCI